MLAVHLQTADHNSSEAAFAASSTNMGSAAQQRAEVVREVKALVASHCTCSLPSLHLPPSMHRKCDHHRSWWLLCLTKVASYLTQAVEEFVTGLDKKFFRPLQKESYLCSARACDSARDQATLQQQCASANLGNAC
jgi:Eukaryotic protein of unknown function (DUF842)